MAMAESHPSAENVARAEYLNTVEGLTFGPDPREGFFRDGVFHHPELRFRMEIPSGWRGINSRSAVQAISEDQGAAIVLTFAEEESPRAALSAFEGQEGVTVTGADERSINGISAVVATFEAATEQTTVSGVIMFPELDGRVYAIYGYSTASEWSEYQRAVTGALSSFQRETDRSVLAVQPNHLEVVEVPSRMSFDEFVRRFPSAVPESTVALINQVEPGESMPAGLAKRVTEG
jgi:predicted Zn-dependent protease